MKPLTVAFIGHRNIENIGEVVKKLEKAVRSLIENENAQIFLFGSKSVFDDISLSTVTELKEKYYPFLKRVYIRATDELISEQYENYLLTLYDETFYPSGVKNAGYRSYIVRNRFMIDGCDILVTYYNSGYSPLNRRTSGTGKAVDYALKKEKRIINLFEL